MKWCNPPPKTAAEPYEPTNAENLANVLTHGLPVLPSLYYSKALLDSATTDCQYFVSIIYGSVLVLLFSISTAYHLTKFGSNRLLQQIFHRLDRAMIYIFIAGSYTPWAHLKLFSNPVFAENFRWIIWMLAIFGVTFQQLFHEKYKSLATLFYVLIGLVPAIATVEMENKDGCFELASGGLFYLMGVIFFKLDGRLPFAHAIWHIHVMIGAIAHYLAISTHLIPSSKHCILD